MPFIKNCLQCCSTEGRFELEFVERSFRMLLFLIFSLYPKSFFVFISNVDAFGNIKIWWFGHSGLTTTCKHLWRIGFRLSILSFRIWISEWKRLVCLAGLSSPIAMGGGWLNSPNLRLEEAISESMSIFVLSWFMF